MRHTIPDATINPTIMKIRTPDGNRFMNADVVLMHEV